MLSTVWLFVTADAKGEERPLVVQCDDGTEQLAIAFTPRRRRELEELIGRLPGPGAVKLVRFVQRIELGVVKSPAPEPVARPS